MRAVALKRTVLPPLRPNLGVESAFRKALWGLVVKMHSSVLEAIEAAYPTHALAQDMSPLQIMKHRMDQIGSQWEYNFATVAREISEGFASGALKNTDAAFAILLRKAGISVKFQATPEMMAAYQSLISENVGLIKSIAEEHLAHVQEVVMESAKAGRSLKELSKDLGGYVELDRIRMGRKLGESDRSLLARTQRRANLIARDQNNRATSIFNRVRQKSLGIEKAIWRHSGGGKTPRPLHEEWDGKPYPVDEGAPIGDDGENVWPGEGCVNCRCVSMSIIPGMDEGEEGEHDEAA